MTQRELIIMHLEKHGSISPKEAYLKYGIMRLASRINELREKDGVNIISVTETSVSYGKKRRYARYMIAS